MTTDKIYVALLEEGADIWRPVPALKIDRNTYVVLQPDDYSPDDEKWEFAPGSVVIVEQRTISDGTILAAVRRTSAGKLSA
jgi:hypothetical protein